MALQNYADLHIEKGARESKLWFQNFLVQIWEIIFLKKFELILAKLQCI